MKRQQKANACFVHCILPYPLIFRMLGLVPKTDTSYFIYSQSDEKFIFKAKGNQHFKKIEALNLAAKNLAIGNFAAFEEFTAFEDSDYDSSDCEEEPPSHGPGPQPGSLPGPQPVPQPPTVKQPPKSDKNHEVKPKESFSK